MKALWITLGVLALLGLACCGGVFFLGRGIYKSVATANAEADDYSAKIFPEIAREWDVSVAWQHASPDFKKEVTETRLKQVFDLYRERLGGMKEVGPFTASNTSAQTNSGDSFVLITTHSTAKFEKGAAKVTLKVVKRGEEWKLVHLELESDQLATK